MAQCLNCNTDIGAGSKRQLEALSLRDTLGKSYTEIGTELGVSRQRAAKLGGGQAPSPPKPACPPPTRPRPDMTVILISLI